MTVDLAIFQCLCILGHHGAIEISFIIIIIYAFSFKVVEVAIPKFRTPLSIWSHLFRGVGHEKRRGEQLKWSLAFRLYIGSFPCAQLPGPVHTARLGRVCFFVCAYLA